jgi:hypothetical protein
LDAWAVDTRKNGLKWVDFNAAFLHPCLPGDLLGVIACGWCVEEVSNAKAQRGKGREGIQIDPWYSFPPLRLLRWKLFFRAN